MSSECVTFLLLGIGGVGKSTVFKQCKILYSGGFSDADKMEGKQCIVQQMVEMLRITIRAGATMNILDGDDADSISERIDLLPPSIDVKDSKALEECRQAIHGAWVNPKVRQSFEKLTKISSTDASVALYIDFAEIFLNRHEEICLPDYLPSDDDMLMFRRETSGIQRLDYKYKPDERTKETKIKLIDVGGQFHERHNWYVHYLVSQHISTPLFGLTYLCITTPH
jgi:hypothetical protein